MRIFIFFGIIIILACLYQSTRETFFTSYPHLYASREMPCDYLAYINPA